MGYVFDCNSCLNKCDGISKGIYIFDNDVSFSERFENQVISEIKAMGFWAEKTKRAQYPDIEVFDQEGGTLLCFIEIKAERRTFMSVKRILPNSDLFPSDTVALNQSDLVHYIEQSRIETVPIYVAWIVTSRPCVVEDGQAKMFYNSICELERIFTNYGDRRRFRRKSGVGDVVNGQHKGVVVNYHFSLDELLPFDLHKILGD